MFMALLQRRGLNVADSATFISSSSERPNACAMAAASRTLFDVRLPRRC
jgi:hypothetical protein